MTFYKPKDLTFTQIAQWVDANHMCAHCDEEKLCQYIYHLVVLKTQQCAFFNDTEQLDDFSLYCTSRLLQKIRKNRQTGEVIKSITNYIKTVIGHYKADYISEFCSGSPEYEIANFDICDFSDYLIDTASSSDFHHYWYDCIRTSDVICNHLKTIPRKKNSAEWTNIYTSCLLTLTDRIRAATEIIKKADIKDPQILNRIIRNLRKRSPILYHLDDTKSMYISVLVNELTHALASEISHSIASKVSVSACMRNLITAASNEEDE